ncbi:hypothetical protein CR51_41190 [Caballeronia megalochromosomata]|jgi:hypothetical protein|nr:hypothetical protein CR51_41190 [Caballeronia megalochromosomata]
MLLVCLVMAPALTHAVDTVDDTVYVPNPRYDWDARVRQTQVSEGEMITLVVHSAKDCIFCARWKGPLSDERKFRAWSGVHPGTRLFIVERAAIASNETPEDYPQDLAWLSERYQKNQRLKPSTPTFEIYVAHDLVFRSHGLSSWDEKAFPAIRDLDSRRSPPGQNVE